MTPTRPAAWPFPYSVRDGRIVRNGPPQDTAPSAPAPKQRKPKRQAPKAEGARW